MALSELSLVEQVVLHGRSYAIPNSFKLAPEYDTERDRVILFSSEKEVPNINTIASKLSDDWFRFFALNNRQLVAMGNSSVFSDMVIEIVYGVIGWFHLRRQDIRKRYTLSGSSSLVYDCSNKLQAPHGFLFTTDYYTEFRDNCDEVVPCGLKAEVIFEQLSATDNIDYATQKCEEYIEKGLAKLVVLLAEVQSTRHETKFDDVYYFTPGRPPHHVQYPRFLDLTLVIPDCKIYLAFSSNNFKYGRKYVMASMDKRVDLLCDFVSNRELDYEAVEELVYGLVNVNLVAPDGRLPLVQACRRGNSQVVELLLREGANKNAKGMLCSYRCFARNLPLTDRKHSFAYIEAVCSGKLPPQLTAQLVPDDVTDLATGVAMNPHVFAYFGQQEREWMLEEIDKLKRTYTELHNAAKRSLTRPRCSWRRIFFIA